MSDNLVAGRTKTPDQPPREERTMINHPNLTDLQRETIRQFEANARECGATIEWVTDTLASGDTELRILETLGGETLTWFVSSEGVAYL